VAACGDHARQRWEGLRAALQRANAERSASVALAAAKVSEFSSLGAIEVGAARTTADEVTRRTASLEAELPRFRRRSRFWNGAALATAAAACFGLVSLLRSEEHTSELQSRENLVCRLLLEKKKK